MVDSLSKVPFISVSTDFWSDKKKNSYLVLTGHYIDDLFNQNPRKKINAKTEVNLGFWRATAIFHHRVAVSNKYRGKPRLSKPPKLETAVVSIIIAVCRIAWKRGSRYLWKFKRNRNNKSHYIARLIKPRFQQIPPQGQICAVRRKLNNPTSLGDCRQLWFSLSSILAICICFTWPRVSLLSESEKQWLLVDVCGMQSRRTQHLTKDELVIRVKSPPLYRTSTFECFR